MNGYSIENLAALRDIVDVLKTRGTISQSDVLTIESLAGNKIITEHNSISKFGTIQDRHNLDIALESLVDFLDSQEVATFTSDIATKLESCLHFLRIFSTNNKFLSDYIYQYDNAVAYNSDNLITPLKNLKIQEFMQFVKLDTVTVGGIKQRYKFVPYVVPVVKKDDKSNSVLKLNMDFDTYTAIIRTGEFANEILYSLQRSFSYRANEYNALEATLQSGNVEDSFLSSSFNLELERVIFSILNIVAMNCCSDDIYERYNRFVNETVIGGMVSNLDPEKVLQDTNGSIYNKLGLIDELNRFLLENDELVEKAINYLNAIRGVLRVSGVNAFGDRYEKAVTRISNPYGSDVKRQIIDTISQGEGRLTIAESPFALFRTYINTVIYMARDYLPGILKANGIMDDPKSYAVEDSCLKAYLRS